MNASERAQVRKRKQLKKQLGKQLTPIVANQTEELRTATREKLVELLGDRPSIATSVEEALYDAHGATGNAAAYRSHFRQLFVALRNSGTAFVDRLANGDLTPAEFVGLSATDLKSPAQKLADAALHDENIRQAVTKEVLPENIQQLKDGRDREKWGVSRSAAAIDN